MSTPRLAIEGVSKHYSGRGEADFAALSSLDIDVRDGELLVLVGPSGCGKSTALRLVAGLDEPTSGRILLDGRDLAGTPPQARDVAMVFQGYALYPHLTAAENMAFPLEMRGVPRAERDARVLEAAAVVGLEDKLGRLPAELSGGERQRVAMGRAIVRRPKLFLFDEPLSNLDAKLRAELRVELVQLVRRLGVTALYVTHDQSEAMTMGDRIAVLRRGELMQLASPRELYERPANRFVAGFVGTPAMNFLELAGCVENESIEVGDGLAAVVGFRPESVAIDGARSSDPPDGGVRIRGRVTLVEPLGAETFVHIDAGGLAVRARVAGFGGPQVGSSVLASVDVAALHWFDDHGRRVEPGT